MGCSAQQHRVGIGLYYGRMCSSSWSHCTGAYKVRVGRGPDPGSHGSWWTFPLLSLVTCMSVYLILDHALTPQTSAVNAYQPSVYREDFGCTQATADNPILERTSGQVRMLLILPLTHSRVLRRA